MLWLARERRRGRSTPCEEKYATNGARGQLRFLRTRIWARWESATEIAARMIQVDGLVTRRGLTKPAQLDPAPQSAKSAPAHCGHADCVSCVFSE